MVKIKSMSYVENISSFIVSLIALKKKYLLVNYVDSPFINEFIIMKTNEILFNKRVVGDKNSLHNCIFILKTLDLISKATDKKLPISSIRVKKFCSETSFVSEEGT